MRAKLNNCFSRVTFFPGQKLIQEGQTEAELYIVIKGLCNFVCTKTRDKMTNLEHEDDPTKKN